MTLPPGMRFPDELLATGMLAVRSARRAIALNPDLPDGHLALAQAYQSPVFLMVVAVVLVVLNPI